MNEKVITLLLTEEEAEFLRAILSDMVKQNLGKLPLDSNATPLQRKMLEAAFKVTREISEAILSKINNSLREADNKSS